MLTSISHPTHDPTRWRTRAASPHIRSVPIVRLPTHLPAYLLTYIPTYLPTYLPSYLPHLPACLPTYLPTYRPTDLPADVQSSIEEKLPGLLPGLTAVKMGPLRAAVLADAGSGGIRLKAFEPPSKEPCDGKPLTPSQIEVQKLLLKTALTLRNDVVESIRRTAVHHVMEVSK